MALTIAAIAATPYMLRLTATNDGEGNASAAITEANLVAACVPGPLKSLFTSPVFEAGPPGPGASTWATLYLDKRLSVSQYPLGAGTNVAALNWTTSPNALTITAAGVVIIELRYDHSLAR